MSLAVEIIGLSVIILQIVLLTGILLYGVQKLSIYNLKEKSRINQVNSHIKNFVDEISFVLAVLATTGSLYFSEILQMEPCPFCWYQRIFMYPLVIILGTAVFLRKSARDFVIPMTMIGGAISIYHVLVQVIGEQIATGCGADGVSCAIIYIQYAGYVTIPVMALTTFAAIFILQWKFKKEN